MISGRVPTTVITLSLDLTFWGEIFWGTRMTRIGRIDADFLIFDDQFSMINFQFSNNFEEGIGVGGGEEFIDPEYGIEFFGAGVGNIVGVPDVWRQLGSARGL
jgi:hypothetical protein